MTSLPTNFVVGSAASGSSFREAFQSCPEDEEAALDIDEDDDDLRTPRPGDARRHETFTNLSWDDASPVDTQEQNPFFAEQTARSTKSSEPSSEVGSGLSTPRARVSHERTPLLRKATSMIERGNHVLSSQNKNYGLRSNHLARPPAARRTSTASAAPPPLVGRSTFGQTLFNSIAIMLGIGILSEPLAFAYAGWGFGTLLIVFYGFLTCYTAKALARVVLADHRVLSYADIGRKAFGPKFTPLIAVMFCIELFGFSVVLVTLYADSLHVVLPAWSSDAYKILGIFILVPTVFLPLSVLSYASMLGIVSTMFLVAVIIIDGFSKPDAPGSLRSPAETNFGLEGMEKLGMAFGLFMAGFGGHAVIPSLARDMIDPSQFDLAMNWAFGFATFIYALIGAAGYIMFGNNVSDEISKDLLGVPSYSPALNGLALWMLVITPLNITFEALLGLSNTPSHSHEGEVNHKSTAASPSSLSHKSHTITRRLLLGVERIAIVLLAVGVSILVPDFSSMMAILGSFSTFIICVIGPLCAKIVLEKRCGMLDTVLLGAGIIMAVWGTATAVLATAE
ncbi:hypothetical protein DENSPDRAFT_857446 [Dentipellis sp. KUC8613]|nr:hypothetical protein DENSPDRAFT_857446 [Dentipellis sp. KUC8613]